MRNLHKVQRHKGRRSTQLFSSLSLSIPLDRPEKNKIFSFIFSLVSSSSSRSTWAKSIKKVWSQFFFVAYEHFHKKTNPVQWKKLFETNSQLSVSLIGCRLQKKLWLKRKETCFMCEHWTRFFTTVLQQETIRSISVTLCNVLISSIYGPKVTLPSLHLASSCHKVLPCQTGGWAMEVFMHNCRENLASQRWRSWRPGRLVQTQLYDYIYCNISY